jgi:hypothetical protein
MRRHFMRTVWCSAVAVALLGATAQATLILPGMTIYPAAAEPDPVGGAVVAGPMTVPFSTASYSGWLITTVITGDTSNLLGGLTFVYELSNSPTSTDAIHRLTVNGFDGFQTDVSYQVGSPGLPPAIVDRSLNGDVIGFGFLNAPLGPGYLQPGLSSASMVVQTDAPAYVRTVASVIDGYVTTVDTYSPVPEPLTAGFMLIGMALVFVRRR